MIGKPEWFTYRIFGWGLRPVKWQGFAYIAVWILVVTALAFLPIPPEMKQAAIGIAVGIILIDTLHIMMQLPKHADERDNYHQLIIERNAAYAAVFSLAGVALFQIYMHRPSTLAMPFDYSIAVVLGVMLLTKIISTIYVKIKM